MLVDSSVWIAAQRPQGTVGESLRASILRGERIRIIAPIQAEVCQGARTEETFHALWEAMLGFEFLPLEDRIWGLSAWNYFRCRRRGLTPGTLDCVVATVAADSRVPLWTLDRGLQRMSGIVGFELFSPPTR